MTSIFPVDHAAEDKGLPQFDGFVLVSVVRREGPSIPIEIAVVENDAARSSAVAFGLARTVNEWHVHLLGDDAGGRRAIVNDLRERYLCESMTKLSA